MVVIKIVLLSMIATVDYSYGEPVDSRCVKVPLIKDFALKEMAGVWYGQEIGNDDEGALRCLYYIASYYKNDTGSFLNIQRIYNMHESNSNKATPYKIFQVGNTNHYRVQWQGQIKHGYTFGTDYKSWATWYLCLPEENDKGILFITTRDRVPSNAAMEEAHDSARKAGFKLTKPYLKFVNQTNCD